MNSTIEDVIVLADSPFTEGVMRADGVTKRFEAHGHETMRAEQDFSRVAEADESKMLNQWHLLISKGMGSACMFKTKEVRRAELDVILE